MKWAFSCSNDRIQLDYTVYFILMLKACSLKGLHVCVFFYHYNSLFLLHVCGDSLRLSHKLSGYCLRPTIAFLLHPFLVVFLIDKIHSINRNFSDVATSPDIKIFIQNGVPSHRIETLVRQPCIIFCFIVNVK